MVKVKQHGWVVMTPDGRLVRFVVFAKDDDWENVPCFLCGDVCLTLQRGENDAIVGWNVRKILHPTGDDQQHCADCCPGCKIGKRATVL